MQNFIHPSHGGSRFDLALIGQEISERMFENNVYIHEHGPEAGAVNRLG